MTLVSRGEWGAELPNGVTRIVGPVRGVTVHWEGPAMGWPWPHSQCARKVRSIQRFHQGTRGWADIAYNALACPHGQVYVGRGPGVRSAANGESAIGGNDQWYAVCYLAGVGDEFTAEGQAAMLEAIAWLRKEGSAGQLVNGHRDHHPTDCPGDVIYRWVTSGLPPDREPVLEEPPMPDLNDIRQMVVNPKADEAEQITLGEALRVAAQTGQRNERRLTQLLKSFAAMPDEIAEAVRADVVNDLAAGGGLEPGELRRIVYAQASRAINNRLGSLNEGK